FKTSAVHRLLTFLRLRSFPGARGDFGSSLPYPELGADHPANEPGIPASVAAARSSLRRNPNRKSWLTLYEDLGEPLPDDFMAKRPVIREIRDGVAIFEDGDEVDLNE
ncbi:MAG: hypothetical protein MPK03_07305, partial [Alphaproteobacteria bacterium]|nr:hypothetical protein [Alphaproteobacteria bacterium]